MEYRIYLKDDVIRNIKREKEKNNNSLYNVQPLYTEMKKRKKETDTTLRKKNIYIPPPSITNSQAFSESFHEKYRFARYSNKVFN